MQNQVEALKAKGPALAEEVCKLNNALEELGTVVQGLRSDLDIPESEEVNKSPGTPKPLPPNRVEVRAGEFANLTDKVNYLIYRLSPVIECVRDI